MNNKKWTIGAIVLVVVMFAVWQVSKVMTSAEPLTEEEAKNKVQELYQGEVVEVTEEKNLYLITIELVDTGTYEIEIDRETGEIGSMTRTKKEVAENGQTTDQPAGDAQEGPQEGSQEEPPKNEPAPSDESKPNNNDEGSSPIETPTPVEPKQPETPKQITESQAISIALSQLNGEVDDIEIGSSGGVTYYLVEIEREEEEEATIQIHAITGEVMSVIWDD